MKRPEDLEYLLEELRSESPGGDVHTLATTCANVYFDPEDDDPSNIRLTESECRHVFANVDTASRFVEALSDVSEASLTIVDLEPSSDVVAYLETCFSTVDLL